MTRRVRALLWLMSGIFCWLLVPGFAQAATLSVNCNAPAGQLRTIGGALKLLDPSVPNTINVSGSCNENVVVQSFERLTLNAVNGASITDASNFNSPVVDFEDSKGYLNGFTTNGGSPGILCADSSQCRFQNNSFQGGFPGVAVSGESIATFNGDTIQGGGHGLHVTHESFAFLVNATVQNTQGGGIGIFVAWGGTVAADPANILNNPKYGVQVLDHGTFHMQGGTISGNGASGVELEGASEVTFQSLSPITISGNGGNGVQINELSFARFLGLPRGNASLTITGNAPNDVQCNTATSATRGATTDIGGGTTNCPN
jgi:hypothetical protein